jgi:GNAT superfamily N-acetyltransferase
MAVTVRKAIKDDAATIANFAVALFELHAAWDDRRFTQIATLDGAERFYGERSEAEGAAVFVAQVGGRLVGFAYMEYEPTLYAELATNAVWLHHIYVEPDARGQRAGKALLAAVRSEAKLLGANKVLLSVAVGNAEGRRLFEQNGFHATMIEMMAEIENNNG